MNSEPSVIDVGTAVPSLSVTIVPNNSALLPFELVGTKPRGQQQVTLTLKFRFATEELRVNRVGSAVPSTTVPLLRKSQIEFLILVDRDTLELFL